MCYVCFTSLKSTNISAKNIFKLSPMVAETTIGSNSPSDHPSESLLLPAETEIMIINDGMSNVKPQTSDSDKVDFDTILKCIGQMGLWQCLLMCVIMYAEYTSTMVNLEVYVTFSNIIIQYSLIHCIGDKQNKLFS